MITALFFIISLCFPFCFFTLFDFPQKRLGRMLTSLTDECEGGVKSRRGTEKVYLLWLNEQ